MSAKSVLAETADLEQTKAVWTGISFIVPITVAILTFGFNFWLQDDQAASELALQTKQAEWEFKLQVAQIIIDTGNPITIGHRAQVLAIILPEYISDMVVSKLNLVDISQPSIEAKEALLNNTIS